MAPAPAFPAPGTPEGDAWAAAGFPRDEQGNAVVPEVAPKDPPAALSLARYTYHDGQAGTDRTQVILVTGTEDSGQVRGFPLGFTDQAAAFTPAMLDY